MVIDDEGGKWEDNESASYPPCTKQGLLRILDIRLTFAPQEHSNGCAMSHSVLG